MIYKRRNLRASLTALLHVRSCVAFTQDARRRYKNTTRTKGLMSDQLHRRPSTYISWHNHATARTQSKSFKSLVLKHRSVAEQLTLKQCANPIKYTRDEE